MEKKMDRGMSKHELKPCPFCGGEARLMDMGFPHWVYCKNCGAKVHGGTHDEKDSIEAWNRRAKDESSVQPPAIIPAEMSISDGEFSGKGGLVD